ncbi:MAG: hypothetical protein MSC31_07405 [Solirubrobacteraceae bacterium MAG38_C4-C5]|nr:hypothetical protein [Candidatus Siliceabacter maunaloa]
MLDPVRELRRASVEPVGQLERRRGVGAQQLGGPLPSVQRIAQPPQQVQR